MQQNLNRILKSFNYDKIIYIEFKTFLHSSTILDVIECRANRDFYNLN